MRIDLVFPTKLHVQLEMVSGPGADQQTKQLLEEINMKLSELPAALASLKTQLTKAKDEIVNKIAAIEVSDPDLSTEGSSALDELRQLAQDLDNINPDAPVKPEPAPAPEPVEPEPAPGEPGGPVSPPVGEESPPISGDQPTLPPEGGVEPVPPEQR